MKPGERQLRRALEPLAAALAHPTTTEIVVNRPGEFGIEQGGRWSWHAAPELTFDRCDVIGILAASSKGENFDEENPFAGATLPDGHRIHCCRPWATESGVISLTIRKPALVSRTMDDDDFEGLFAATNAGPSKGQRADAELVDLMRARRWRAFYKLAVRVGKTIATCGPTGSGKTDLLKRFLGGIPDEERIVTIQNAAETGAMRQRNYVHLFYSFGEQGSGGITVERCVEATLRMRPDRPMIGELRNGAEAYGFLRILAAGHKGGLTTWHAEEGEAFEALELMIKQHSAGAKIPDAKVRAYLRRYLDIIVWCDKGDDGYGAPKVWFRAAEDAEAAAAVAA